MARQASRSAGVLHHACRAALSELPGDAQIITYGERANADPAMVRQAVLQCRAVREIDQQRTCAARSHAQLRTAMRATDGREQHAMTNKTARPVKGRASA